MAKVRACRIGANSASGQATGVLNVTSRRPAIHTLTTTLKQAIGIRHTGGIMWQNRNQFISWHVQWERMDEHASGQLFDSMVENPNIEKMMLGSGQVRVAVFGQPTLHR